MPVIDWSDTYALEIEQIDEHHRHLFNLLNETYEVFVSHGEKVEVERIIEELVNYATYHFAAEEHLMSAWNYRHANDHLKQHYDFVQQITTLQQEFYHGRTALTLELIVFLKDWLVEHILKSDKDYADAIRPRMEQALQPGAAIDLA